MLSPEEGTRYGIIDLVEFQAITKAELLADYTALSPADRTGTPNGRNLATRIAHLGADIGMGNSSIKPSLAGAWIVKRVYWSH
jgi:hypothetical protein